MKKIQSIFKSFPLLCIVFVIIFYHFNALFSVNLPIDTLQQCKLHTRSLIVLGDLHGDFTNTVTLLYHSGLIQLGATINSIHWAGKNKILVQLGDIVDRGPDGYLIYSLFQRLGHEARLAGGDIIHLFGNHEAANLCGIDAYINPQEIANYYDNNVTLWKEIWSTTGSLGMWIRESFHVFTVLLNRFIFVHAGISPYIAQFTPEQLKSVLLHRVDNEFCMLSTISEEQTQHYHNGTFPFHTLTQQELLQAFSVNTDILWGPQSPLWLRYFSLGKEEDICHNLQQSISTILSRIQPLQTCHFKKNQFLLNSHSSDSPSSSFMIVGHTPTVSGNIESKCWSPSLGTYQSNKGHYIMTDTGISHFVANRPNCLEIIITGNEEYDDIYFYTIKSDGSKIFLMSTEY